MISLQKSDVQVAVRKMIVSSKSEIDQKQLPKILEPDKGTHNSVTCEIPFSTFETRSRFLPPYHVVRDRDFRDRDFSSLNLMFRDKIEIFHH